MPKNRLILEKIIAPTAEKDEHDDDEDYDQESIDSDEELANDFAAGKLKPGLYGMVPFKRTSEQINDQDGLTKKLNDIKLFENNWLERLDMISEPAPITPELLQQYGDLELKVNRKGEISGENQSTDSAQNDFKREMLFYRQAQTTVMDCIKLLHNKYNIKNTRRPDDYFAEMLKTDEHMKKVYEKLETKQQSMEASDKAKRQRQLKKYGKKVQQEIQLKRQQEKRELLDKIQKYKKGKLESLDFLDSNNGQQQPSSSKQANNNKQKQLKNKKLTKKQKYKESKYGYGGRKKRSKYNSSQSSADMSSFSVRKHGRPKMKKNRPGKSRRQKMRNKS